MAHTAQQSDMHHIGDGTQDDRLVAFFMVIDARKWLLQSYRATRPTGDYPKAIEAADYILACTERELRHELRGTVRQQTREPFVS